ncbi:MAG: helix-turn-helix domain-containing protein [Candidatus Tectimicrobiota bacterium]
MGQPPQATQERTLQEFGRRLQRLRKARNLRQLDMGSLGLNYKYYQRLELGQVNPTLLTLHRIARALGVSVAELLFADTEASSRES